MHFFLLIVGLLLPVSIRGAALSQEALPSGARIGVLLSTFDPITSYHEEVITAALATQDLDYILVVPTDFTPQKPNRTTMDHRQNMLNLHFAKNPRVLTAQAYQNGFPQSRNLIKELAQSPKGFEIVGVALHNDVADGFFKQKIINFLSPVKKWMIGTPANTDRPMTELAKKPARSFIVEHPKSSSIVSRTLKNNNSFFEEESPHELPISPEVESYIRTNRLYFKASKGCRNILIDIWRSL